MPGPQICPRCGEPMVDEVCTRCMLEKYEILEKPIELSLRVCPDCGAVDTGSGWKQSGEIEGEGLLQIARNVITENIRVPPPGRILNLEIEPLGSDEYLMNFVIRVRVEVGVETIEREGRARVKIRRAVCDSCSRARGSYYEAKLQLRAEGRKPDTDEVEKCYDLVFNIVEEQHSQGDQKSFITEVITKKEGTDFYVGSVKVARRISGAITREFGAETRESSSLAGRKDGRELYRISISVRLPGSRVGDIVRGEGKLFVVEKVRTNIKGYELPSHHAVEVKRGDIKHVGSIESARNGVVVTVEPDEIQVVEPWGNRCVILTKPEGMQLVEGMETSLLRVGDEMFILRGEPSNDIES